MKEHQARSAENIIAAPRIIPYVGFGMGQEAPILTAKQARDWVRDIARQGASGIKFFGATPEIMTAALDEANVNRFVDMVHQMTDRSQFIFITHNKVTMVTRTARCRRMGGEMVGRHTPCRRPRQLSAR